MVQLQFNAPHSGMFPRKQTVQFGADKPKPEANPNKPEPEEKPSRMSAFWKKLGLNQAPQCDEPYSHIPENFQDFMAAEFMNDQRVKISGLDILGAFIKNQAKLDGKLATDPEFIFGKRSSFRGIPVDAGEKSAYLEFFANQFGFHHKTSQLLMFRNFLESGVLSIGEQYVQDEQGHTSIKRGAYLTDKAVHLYHERTLKGLALKKYLDKHASFFQHPDKPSLTTYNGYSEPSDDYYSIRGGKTAPGWEKRLGIALATALPLGGLLYYANSQQSPSQPAPQVQVSPATPTAPKSLTPPQAQPAAGSTGVTAKGKATTTESPNPTQKETPKVVSNRLTSVDQAIQGFQAGRFESQITEIPHHNGFSSFVFQEKSKTVAAPLPKNPKATRLIAGDKFYLPDLNAPERARLQEGIEANKGTFHTSAESVSNAAAPQTVVAPNASSNSGNLLTGLLVTLIAIQLLMSLSNRNGGKNSELAKKQLALMERQLKQHENMEKFSQIGGNGIEDLPDTRFDQVGGNFVAKEELRSIVSKIKRRINGEDVLIPKGILLEGSPGNGKTLLARAVAGEAGIPFYSLSGSEFNQMFVGVGAGRIRDVFAKAKENAPAIIFIDEIDAIAQARATSSNGLNRNEERESTLTELLRQMDGFEGSDNVFVLAATNRKDVLDTALTDRPSRFKYSIFVDNPRSDEEREEVLAIHQKRAIQKLNVQFPEKVDGLPFLTKLAQITRGLSGDKLQHVILEAGEVAQARAEAAAEKAGETPGFKGLPSKIEGDTGALEAESTKPLGTVTMADCIEAYQKIQHGHLSKVKHSMSAREQVAHHEHGHNLMTYALFKKAPLVISMFPRNNHSLGRIILDPTVMDEQLQSQNDLLSRVLLYMGGTASEEYKYGRGGRTTGNHADIDSAQKNVLALISHGLLDDNYAVNVNRHAINELNEQEKNQLNQVIRNAKATALAMLDLVGKEKMDAMVKESLDCDHEMVSEEAGEFTARHLDPHWEQLNALAQSFLDNPLGDKTAA